MTRDRVRTTTTRKGQTLMKGHTLRHEGAPYQFLHGTLVLQKSELIGRALCSCGVASEMLTSTRARKRWHVEHKAEVRVMLTTLTPEPAISEVSEES